ncbi:unnamed protein product [Aureobasidium pullulans]|nr:unnamed protein product [Aureobasidium pullulans]
MAAACIFCKIIKGTVNIRRLQATPEKQQIANTTTNHTGEIPSMKLFESEKVFAFLDINPLSYGHAKIAQAVGADNYNILQNNGKIAHQVVDHVHFHMIPKPNEKEGLGISWPQQQGNQDKLKALKEEILAKM